MIDGLHRTSRVVDGRRERLECDIDQCLQGSRWAHRRAVRVAEDQACHQLMRSHAKVRAMHLEKDGILCDELSDGRFHFHRHTPLGGQTLDAIQIHGQQYPPVRRQACQPHRRRCLQWTGLARISRRFGAALDSPHHLRIHADDRGSALGGYPPEQT